MGVSNTLKKSFLRNKAVFVAIFCGLLINGAMWIVVAINEISANIPIPLHYNAYYGVDYLGDYRKIFIIPAVGLVIITINSILGFLLDSKCKVASKILFFIIPFLQILLMASTISIILFNK
ncbi:hypothetical protein D4R87_00365 [bacterium]|nr:MAG: hypothetical protein D4R87_00365 [bacterium]